MSRLGVLPVQIPSGVKVELKGSTISVEGAKGRLSRSLPDNIAVDVQEKQIEFKRRAEDKVAKANHGLVRSLVRNMVQGVSEGFTKKLVSVGVGYRVSVSGNKVNLNLGFSHPMVFELPKEVSAKVEEQTKLVLSSADRELLGRMADKIRKIRPPEPYKGKGIRYEGEEVQLKEGKAAGK